MDTKNLKSENFLARPSGGNKPDSNTPSFTEKLAAKRALRDEPEVSGKNILY